MLGIGVSPSLIQLQRTGVASAFDASFVTGASTAIGSFLSMVRTTRSTLATQIGPDGTLQWGPHNLYAESGVLVTQGVAVAAGSYIVSFSGTGSVTLSGAATGTINGTGTENRVYLLVSTTAGTLTSTVTGSVTSAQLETVTGTNRTTPSDYVDSTVKNRTQYSNDFVSGGAGWAKPAVNMYPAASTLADGTPMTLAVATAASAQHQFYVAAAAISGVATGQIMARDGGARYIQVLSAAVSDQYANFDLQTGAVTAKGAGCLWAGAVWINGAWCCSAQFNGTAATFYYSLANSPTAGWLPTFTGDGLNGVYIANACTLPGTGKPDGAGGYLPIPYFYNPAAAPSVGPIYAQRTDYDVSTVSGIGPNLVTDPTVSLTGWASGASLTSTRAVVNGEFQVTSTTTFGRQVFQFPTVANNAYRVSGSCRLLSGNFAYIAVSQAGGELDDAILGTTASSDYADYSKVVVANGSTLKVCCSLNSLGGVGAFRNIVVQEAFSGAIAGYGPELAATASWSSGGGTGSSFTITGDSLTGTSSTGSNVIASKTLATIPGRSYFMIGTMSDLNSGSALRHTARGTVVLDGAGYSATSRTSFGVFVASSTSTVVEFVGGAASVSGTLSAVSIKEIIFASKGALIEPTQVTQLLANPDNLGASPWSGACAATNDGTKFKGRPMWKLTKTTTGTSEPRLQTGPSISGNTTQRIAFLASANSSIVGFGLYGNVSGWGNNVDSTMKIESGPGTLAQSTGALGLLSGLSTNVPTVVSVTKNVLSAEITSLYIYPDQPSSTTIGKAIYVQVDNLEAGTSPTSFIPNPSSSGTVVRVADTSSVGYDDLVKALPWLMDTNLLADPEGTAATLVTASGVTTAATTVSGYANSIQFPASNTLNAAYRTVTNAASTVYTFQCVVQMDDNSVPVVGATSAIGDFSVQANNAPQGGIVTPLGGGAYLVTCTYLSGGWTSCGIVRYVSQSGKGFRVTAMKDNPGPVAQTYYPQSSKQGTIVFEGDLVFGPASGGMSLFALENGASNRVELYKGSASNTLSGLFNVNSGSPGNIASGTIFKSLIGFSPSSAGAVLNGGAEAPITPTAFAANPNVLKIGNDANGNAASSMHLRRLRLFNTNLPSSTKQALTR